MSWLQIVFWAIKYGPELLQLLHSFMATLHGQPAQAEVARQALTTAIQNNDQDAIKSVLQPDRVIR